MYVPLIYIDGKCIYVSVRDGQLAKEEEERRVDLAALLYESSDQISSEEN